MASTTYVQFLKGGLLIIFSTVTGDRCCCYRGLTTEPDQGGRSPPFHSTARRRRSRRTAGLADRRARLTGAGPAQDVKTGETSFAKLTPDGDGVVVDGRGPADGVAARRDADRRPRRATAKWSTAPRHRPIQPAAPGRQPRGAPRRRPTTRRHRSLSPVDVPGRVDRQGEHDRPLWQAARRSTDDDRRQGDRLLPGRSRPAAT